MMNTTKSQMKRSKMNRKLNICFLLLIISYVLLSCVDSTNAFNRRTKRDAVSKFIKKKGLGLAATALLAATKLTKAKVIPIPIPFKLPIRKPPIIDTIVPPPIMPWMIKGSMMGIGMGMGMGGFGGGGYG